MTEPILPYEDSEGERTAGWSGSESSHARASHDVLDGTASKRQKRALDLVTQRRWAGLTWKELAVLTGEHHGQVSGVLSVLHQGGRIVRLTTQRAGSQIYVHPDYVDGRALSPYKKREVKRRPLTPKETVAYQAAALRLGKIGDGASNPMVCLYADDLRLLLAVVEEHL
jgi:hypothetical protein